MTKVIDKNNNRKATDGILLYDQRDLFRAIGCDWAAYSRRQYVGYPQKRDRDSTTDDFAALSHLKQVQK